MRTNLFYAVLALATTSCSVLLPLGEFKASDDDGRARDGANADRAEATVQDAPAPVDVAFDAPSDVAVDAAVDVEDASPEASVDAPADVAADRADACAPALATCEVASSCRAHFDAGRSADGLYLVDHDGRDDTAPVRVACEGGWTRVLRVDGRVGCPEPLRLVASLGVCVRASSASGSATPLVIDNLVRFHEVRGRADLIGFGGVDAFTNPAPNVTWDAYYVDGVTVSLLGATPPTRRHLWTWALGGETALPASGIPLGQPCPCHGGGAPVAEVGANYLCADTLPAGVVAATLLTWRERATAWLSAGDAGACARGDAEGAFAFASPDELSGALEVRLVLSGASYDSALPAEDVGIRGFDLLVR